MAFVSSLPKALFGICAAWLVFWAGGAWAADSQPDAAGIEFFEKKVRPVLVAQCQKCHGPEKQEQGLRVDSLAALVAGGDTGPAVVPGKPAESLLVGAIQHGEVYQMPPKTKLPAAQIADLIAWVKMGAPWPDAKVAVVPMPPGDGNKPAEGPLFTPEQKAFWAFQSPVAAPLPPVKDSAWCQSPLDRFILAGLEEKGLTPAPPADKRTLIRRATFDMLGLPPTPAEVEAFLADNSPEAFARVVDRLLASPHYGERWARHWLDVARYADSNGMDENVAYANAWRYRDYVVAALNKDKPYDRFVREQLAGDLLHESGDDDLARTAERVTATGFLVIGPKMLAEDDPRKMEMDIVDEQLDTVGRTFLGLTLGCARCHDHKFDPLPAADYYSLAAIFKSTKTMENFKVVAMWHERPVGTPEFVARREELLRIAKAKQNAVVEYIQQTNETLVAPERVKADRYLAAAVEFQKQKAAALKPLMDDAATATAAGVIVLEAEKFDRGNVVRDFTQYGEKIGVVYNAGELPNFTEYDITLAEAGGYQLELRFAAADSRPTEILLDGKLLKTNAAAQATGSWHPDKQAWSVEALVLLAAGKHTIRLQRNGPFPHFDKLALVPRAVPEGQATSATPKSLEQLASDSQLNLLFLKKWVKHLEKAEAAPSGEALAQLVADPKGPFALPKDQKEIEAFYSPEAKAEIERRRAEQAAAEKAVPAPLSAMAASDGKIENLRIHLRGNYLTLDREVPRQFPRILAGENQTPIDAAHSGRRELAEWMTRPDHPLTARVMVNRVWHWHFGNGIVRSPDNFGRLGELPDNQPLLDWLAVRFVAEGWSLKWLHREIMLSSTYQMSGKFDERAALADPENRLRWRYDRRRLEAEALRDGVLAVCGELDTLPGGTLLTTENHKYVTSTASEKLNFFDGGRRSIYLPVTRSSVYELFQAFDFADPSAPNGQRATTTIAPQALALMNSRLLDEQTGRWAQRLIDDSALDDAGRVRTIYELAFSRPPNEKELSVALDFVQRVESLALLAKQPAPDARRRGWQSLCRVILASSEFIYVE